LAKSSGLLLRQDYGGHGKYSFFEKLFLVAFPGGGPRGKIAQPPWIPRRQRRVGSLRLDSGYSPGGSPRRRTRGSNRIDEARSVLKQTLRFFAKKIKIGSKPSLQSF